MNLLKQLFSAVLVLGLLALSNARLSAQDLDNQLWMNYAVKVPVSDRLSWGGDTGVRREV